MKIKHALAAISLSLLSSQCLAGITYHAVATATGNAIKNDTQFYAGLNWNLGGTRVPDAVIGVRFARIDSAGKVYGSDLSASMPLSNFGLGKIKAKYIDGTDNGQGEIGLGYNFVTSKYLGTVGYSLPYANIGTDYMLDSGFEPFAGIHTMDSYDKPNKSGITYTCPRGGTLNPVTLICG